MTAADELRFMANVAEYAAMKGLSFSVAKQEAERDYWSVLGDIHQWGAA